MYPLGTLLALYARFWWGVVTVIAPLRGLWLDPKAFCQAWAPAQSVVTRHDLEWSNEAGSIEEASG